MITELSSNRYKDLEFECNGINAKELGAFIGLAHAKKGSVTAMMIPAALKILDKVSYSMDFAVLYNADFDKKSKELKRYLRRGGGTNDLDIIVPLCKMLEVVFSWAYVDMPVQWKQENMLDSTADLFVSTSDRHWTKIECCFGLYTSDAKDHKKAYAKWMYDMGVAVTAKEAEKIVDSVEFQTLYLEEPSISYVMPPAKVAELMSSNCINADDYKVCRYYGAPLGTFMTDFCLSFEAMNHMSRQPWFFHLCDHCRKEDMEEFEAWLAELSVMSGLLLRPIRDYAAIFRAVAPITQEDTWRRTLVRVGLIGTRNAFEHRHDYAPRVLTTDYDDYGYVFRRPDRAKIKEADKTVELSPVNSCDQLASDKEELDSVIEDLNNIVMSKGLKCQRR